MHFLDMNPPCFPKFAFCSARNGYLYFGSEPGPGAGQAWRFELLPRLHFLNDLLEPYIAQ